jgi:acyl-CoA thioester hydrolase
MERARSDMLSRAGIDQNAAFQQGEGVYAVTSLAIKYRRPARFADDLLVISTVERLAAASVDIHQRVMLGSEVVADALLTDALVTAAFLTPNGRPRRQPEAWRAAFQSLLPETTPYA